MTESITVPIALLRDSASMLIDHLERVAGEGPRRECTRRGRAQRA